MVTHVYRVSRNQNNNRINEIVCATKPGLHLQMGQLAQNEILIERISVRTKIQSEQKSIRTNSFVPLDRKKMVSFWWDFVLTGRSQHGCMSSSTDQNTELCVLMISGASSTGSECTAAVGTSGQVFGLPLSKCIANDMALGRYDSSLSGIWTAGRSPQSSSPLTPKPSLRHR